MGLCSARLAANRETCYHDRHPLVCVSTLPLRNNRLRRPRRLTMWSFAAPLQPAMRLGGVGTPPTSQESAASLALVPNKCACREWPLCESAQVVEWPRHLCWCFRQCRSPKSCVMVGRCATYSRPLGWRARNPSGRPQASSRTRRITSRPDVEYLSIFVREPPCPRSTRRACNVQGE